MMRPHLLLFLCLPLLGADSPSSGPTLPSIKGVTKVSTAPLWVTYGVKGVLRNLPGATVVVEDSMPDILPHDLSYLSLLRNSLRLRGFDQLPDGRIARVADWMNSQVIMSGGNVVQRNYDAVGFGF